MDHNAAGQLLGYSIQFPRGLYHLLLCGEGDRVCIEVLGDVATVKSDGTAVIEEDKSSISANPLTDKSTDLWKTFYNWIKAIKSGDIDVNSTRFIIYTNQKGRKALVHEFDKAKTEQEVGDAIIKATEKIGKLDRAHEVWGYYDFCVNQNPDLFKKVVTRFELDVMTTGSGFDEVRKEIKKKFIPDTQIEFFLENMSGWLQKTIMEKIASKELASIQWVDFYGQFSKILDRIRKRELIDFTLEAPPSETELKSALKLRPCYVRQLDKINLTDDEILESVAEYLKAKVNRGKWIELEIIDQDVASDFETKLSKFWENTKKKIALTQKSLSEEEKGHLLLIECKSRQEMIRDMIPPAATIAGTYHALADGPMLGWHNDWEKVFKQNDE